jgi:hypothetical protein
MAFLNEYSCEETQQPSRSGYGGKYTFFFHFKKTEHFGSDSAISD